MPLSVASSNPSIPLVLFAHWLCPWGVAWDAVPKLLWLLKLWWFVSKHPSVSTLCYKRTTFHDWSIELETQNCATTDKLRSSRQADDYFCIFLHIFSSIIIYSAYFACWSFSNGIFVPFLHITAYFSIFVHFCAYILHIWSKCNAIFYAHCVHLTAFLR